MTKPADLPLTSPNKVTDALRVSLLLQLPPVDVSPSVTVRMVQTVEGPVIGAAAAFTVSGAILVHPDNEM